MTHTRRPLWVPEMVSWRSILSLEGIRLTQVADGLLIHPAVANELKVVYGQPEEVAHTFQQLVRVRCGIFARLDHLDPFIRLCLLVRPWSEAK